MGRSYTANLAIDGDTNGNFLDGSVASTSWEYNPSWSVYFDSPKLIGKIKVYNRNDCCQHRLSDFYVDIYDEDNNPIWRWSHGGGTPDDVTTIPVLPSKLGSRVRILVLGDNRILSLAEVEIFNASPPSAMPSAQTSQIWRYMGRSSAYYWCCSWKVQLFQLRVMVKKKKNLKERGGRTIKKKFLI